MKASFVSALAAVAGTASAHYQFPELQVGGTKTGLFTYVRKTTNFQSNGPVTDVSSNQIRCYELAPGTPSQTYTVKAGDTVGFSAISSVSHPGPMQFYMAKAPGAAADFDGSGAVWFKIYQEEAIITSSSISWASMGKATVSVTLPKSLPSGDYLLRAEHIALHAAGATGGAQFYLSCAQLTVTNGGSGSPGPLVSLPGAYSASDPGIKLNIYYPVPKSYTPPGPKVWTG